MFGLLQGRAEVAALGGAAPAGDRRGGARGPDLALVGAGDLDRRRGPRSVRVEGQEGDVPLGRVAVIKRRARVAGALADRDGLARAVVDEVVDLLDREAAGIAELRLRAAARVDGEARRRIVEAAGERAGLARVVIDAMRRGDDNVGGDQRAAAEGVDEALVVQHRHLPRRVLDRGLASADDLRFGVAGERRSGEGQAPKEGGQSEGERGRCEAPRALSAHGA